MGGQSRFMLKQRNTQRVMDTSVKSYTPPCLDAETERMLWLDRCCCCGWRFRADDIFECVCERESEFVRVRECV